MNNIKNIIASFVIASAAIAYGASSQTATAPAGVDNFAIGYGAGYKSGGQNTNVVCIGTDAGMQSTNNTDCVSLGTWTGKKSKSCDKCVSVGYRACEDSYGNEDCTFIGSNAGLNSENDSSCVFIGKDTGMNAHNCSNCIVIGAPDVDLLSGKSNYINIGGKIVSQKHSGEKYLDIVLDDGDFFGVYGLNTHCFKAGGAGEVTLCDHFNVDPSGKTTLFGRDVAVIGGPMSGTLPINGFVFQNGEFCVYTNGVKAGTLAFTPAQ